MRRDMDCGCAPFGAIPFARMIDQDATHHLRRDGKKMRPIAPVHVMCGQETQECLLNERGGLNEIAIALSRQMSPG
jgi:hypothetical protein